MSKPYTISEVDVYLESGVTVRARVETVADIKTLLEDLAAANLGSLPTESASPGRAREDRGHDEPLKLIATRAGLTTGALANLVAIKDGTPQLLRPGVFANNTDATLALIHAMEVGLKRPTIARDEFSSVFELQNLKAGSPLSVVLTNLRNSGYLDKNTYSKDKSIRLTGKGEKKAIEVLTAATTGK